jgi:hypothetical protein
MATVKWGFLTTLNNSDLPRQWPEKSVMGSAAKQHNSALFAWRCELSNHGPNNVLDLHVPIKIWFGNEKAEVTYTVIITPLDAGDKFVFYMLNDCPTDASAVWEDEVMLQVLGESSRRKVPLRRKFKSLGDQIMMFFPSTTRLVGGEPCQ